MDTGKQLTPSEAGDVPVAVPPQAEAAAVRLRAALAAAGFDVDRDFAFCRADVTVSGMGSVTLGRLSVTTADRLAEVLEAFAAHEGERADGALPNGRRAGSDDQPTRDEDPC